MKTTALLGALALTAAPALAQQVDPNHKFAWGENIGFLNFADAGNPPGAQGVFAYPTHLEGFVWGENIGWINLGDGDGPYANTTGLNFGVNRDPDNGHLSGFAWAENVGWINFSGGALASPANPARIENNRFRGFAWGENIGWINLDDPNVFVRLVCPADINGDGLLNFFDVADFIALYNNQDPRADLAPPFGVWNFFDIAAYMALYNEGCP
ncbi:MAG: hypothetical protein JJU44_02235 [Planctomycetes bacterium]|nr:hypothetical protein [Planctomycetota bacterium]